MVCLQVPSLDFCHHSIDLCQCSGQSLGGWPANNTESLSIYRVIFGLGHVNNIESVNIYGNIWTHDLLDAISTTFSGNYLFINLEAKFSNSEEDYHVLCPAYIFYISVLCISIQIRPIIITTQ